MIDRLYRSSRLCMCYKSSLYGPLVQLQPSLFPGKTATPLQPSSYNPCRRRYSAAWRMTRASASRRGAAQPAAGPAAVAALLDRFSHSLPTVIVFDLDYTLWPFWCEMFQPYDTPWLYPDVPAILEGLREKGVKLAVASRTPTPHVANAFLDKLSMRRHFCSIQLIPAADGFDHTSAQKDKAHLPNIQRDLRVPYREMLFFDDEHGNIRRVSQLGVLSILVDTSTGVSLESLEQGLKAYADARRLPQ